MILTPEQAMKLKQAATLLAEVQIDMLKADEAKPQDQRDDQWRRLYRVRCELGELVYWWTER